MAADSLQAGLNRGRPGAAPSAGSASGLLLGVISAATFGTAGVFASSLLEAGWSPAAAVLARITFAAVALAVPAAVAMRGRTAAFRAQWRRHLGAVVAFGVVGIAACQLFYFNALQYVTVGVALLLEYLGGVLVVGWVWWRTRRRPSGPTFAGIGLALVGLVLVLDLMGGARIAALGVMWGLLAAVALAVYFVLAARTEDALPPIVVCWGGMVVGAIVIALLGAVRAVPLTFGATQVTFLDHRMSWWIPALGLSLVAAALAYVTGLAAARRLGPTVAPFVALLEVVAAIVFAWLFLGQLPRPVQLIGGVLVVAGAAVVRWAQLRQAARTTQLRQAAQTASDASSNTTAVDPRHGDTPDLSETVGPRETGTIAAIEQSTAVPGYMVR